MSLSVFSAELPAAKVGKIIPMYTSSAVGECFYFWLKSGPSATVPFGIQRAQDGSEAAFAALLAAKLSDRDVILFISDEPADTACGNKKVLNLTLP